MSFQKIYRYFIQEQEFIALSFYGTLIQFLVQFRHVLRDVPHQLLLSRRECSHRQLVDGEVRLHEHPSVVPCDDRIDLQSVHNLVTAYLSVL